MFPYIWNFIIPIDFHMFQRGRLNHQPECVRVVFVGWAHHMRIGCSAGHMISPSSWLAISMIFPGDSTKPLIQSWSWFMSRYPLVLTNIANWKIIMLLMGKLTISTAIFNSYVKVPESISKLELDDVRWSGFVSMLTPLGATPLRCWSYEGSPDAPCMEYLPTFGPYLG